MRKYNKLFTRLRDLIHPFVLLLTKTRVKFSVVCNDRGMLLSDKPIIFAINHTNSFDSPIVAKATWKTLGMRSVILAGKQNLWLSDKLFFFLNGVIWVNRKSKQEMAAVKNTLIAYLNKKQAIMWFPEGTWNLTDNLLMLPMKWGIIDVAVQAGAQIVPVVLDYDRKTMSCHVNFGMPIAPDETTNKADAIRELRDAMATLRWELWEKQEPLKRDEIDRAALKEDMYVALKEYPPLDWEYEQSVVFQPCASPQDKFAHLEHLIPCRENAFLRNKRYHDV